MIPPLTTEEELYQFIRYAPIGICVLNAKTFGIEVVNDAYLVLLGKSAGQVNDGFILDSFDGLRHVLEEDLARVAQGETIRRAETEASVIRNGQQETVAISFVYVPVKNKAGDVTRIAVWVSESNPTSKQDAALASQEPNQSPASLAQSDKHPEENLRELTQRLTENDARLRSILKQATAGIMICNGRELVVESVNDMMLGIISKSAQIIGKRFTEALPEFADQGLFDVINEVYTSGVTFIANEAKVAIEREGQLVEGYYNFSYQAITNQEGLSTGILIVATDVTTQVHNRLETERLEKQLRLAVESARIGTWYIKPDTKALEYNAMLADIFGYEGDENMTYDQAIGQVTDEYRPLILKAIEEAIADGGDYEFTYMQRRFNDGKLIWLRSLGKIMQDENGNHSLFSGVVIDITEHMEALTALEESERRFRTMAESTEVFITTYNATGAIEYMNKSWLSFLGKPLTDMYELGWEHIIHPDDRDEMYRVFRDGLQARAGYAMEYRILNKNDEYRWMYTKAAPRLLADGSYAGIVSSSIDITERKQYQQQLQLLNNNLAAANEKQIATNQELQALNEELTAANEDQSATNNQLLQMQEHLQQMVSQLEYSQSRFQNLIRDANVGIIVLLGDDMQVDIVNNAYAKLIGRRADELNNRPLFNVIPEAEASFRPILDNVRLTGEPLYLYGHPYSVNSNNNVILGYLNLAYQPYHNTSGEITGVIVLCQDVTEQVTASKKVEQAEEKLQLAIETAELGIWTLDWTSQVLTMSSRAYEMHGIPVSDMVTLQGYVDLIDADYSQLVADSIAQAIESRERFLVEYILHPVNSGTPKWLRSTGKASDNEHGEPVSITGTILDITEQKNDEQRKNDFIGMVSHELKTPLTSMKAYLQMMQIKAQRINDNFSANALEKANNQVKKMTTLINGFLNVSRLESGKININKQQFDMAELVKEAEEETLSMISSHQVVFEPVLTTFVNADRDKIGQVINNFISNAVKYSPIGTTINVACIAVGSNMQVSVKDEGMGISQQDIDHLFDRYYRVENKSTHNISGFGIGLYLCAEIINRHEGKIWAESEVGKGSTFYFTLPLDMPQL